MSDLDTSKIYEKTSELLKSWGTTVLPNGKTLSETMMLSGIPLWDLMCPELAVYNLPKVYLPNKKPFSTLRHLRPYLGRAKQIVLEDLFSKKNSNGCSAWPKDSTALVLGFSPIIYKQVLEPFSKNLLAQFSLHPIVLSDSCNVAIVPPVTDGYGIQSHSIWQHWNKHVDEKSRIMSKELKKIRAELKAMCALECILQEDQKSLMAEMQYVFTWLMEQRLPQLLPHIATASHLLEQHKPALIMSGDVADPRTRVFYVLGKQHGIPSLEIQYGMAGLDSVEYKFALADHVAAFGEQSRRIMIEYGVHSERISVTGSPRHDKLINYDVTKTTRIRSELGVPEGNTMVLFAAPYYISGFSEVKKLGLQMTEDLFAAADKITNLSLVVKPHPILHKTHELEKIADNKQNIIFSDPKANTQVLIQACDAFISLGSTTTLDALIANKLTITPAYPEWRGNDEFVKSGATLVPRSAAEVIKCLEIAAGVSSKKTLADLEPSRNCLLFDFVYKTDGQAGDRILKIASKMLQDNTKRQIQ